MPTPDTQYLKPIRVFIAVDISCEAVAEAANIIERLRAAQAEVKWVKPGSIHLTLKFLGDIYEEKIPVIKKQIEKAAEKTASFDLNLDGLGVFPGWSRPGVIWTGLSGDIESLRELAHKVGYLLEKKGFDKENREFKAHLTLGRIKGGKNKDKLKDLSEKIKVAPIRSHIDKIVLFRSELTPQGAIYTPLAEACFRN